MKEKQVQNVQLIETALIRYQENETEKAFNELYKLCHTYLFRYFRTQIHSDNDLLDLLSIYFERDFPKATQKYKADNSSFIYYILRIVRFRCYSYLRSHKTSFSLNEIKETWGERAYPTLYEEDTLYPLIKSDIKVFFRKSISSIKNPNHQIVLVITLCSQHKLSQQKISDSLGCTPTSYSTWLYRGKLILASLIRKHIVNLSFDLTDLLLFAREEGFWFLLDEGKGDKQWLTKQLINCAKSVLTKNCVQHSIKAD